MNIRRDDINEAIIEYLMMVGNDPEDNRMIRKEIQELKNMKHQLNKVAKESIRS